MSRDNFQRSFRYTKAQINHKMFRFPLVNYITLYFSWFVGPEILLQDCLAAFFTSDELQGNVLNSPIMLLDLKNIEDHVN